MTLFSFFEPSEQADPDPAPDSEIPPAIACAQCGQTSCEGCTRDAGPQHPKLPPSHFGWEQSSGTLGERLLDTALTTVRAPEATFSRMAQGSLLSALSFALLCEFWAVLSFTLPWALAFCAVFPRLSLHMLSSPSVLLLGLAIFSAILFGVIGVHLLWGASLEWSIARTRVRSRLAHGLRFGLYACGWDLITSPAGYVLVWRAEGRGRAWESFRAGARVPRRAMTAYLQDCRGLSGTDEKTAVRTGIAITAFVMLIPLLAGFLALVAWMLSY